MKSILEFGARPGTEQDHSPIIEKALEQCDTLYFPSGVYYISRPILLQKKNLIGESSRATEIRLTSRELDAAVIKAGGMSQIERLTLGFADGIVTGEEKKGQRVGLLTGCDSPLGWGSCVRNVRINYCGTGIYSDESIHAESFSVHYDTLEISEFSYRGVDFVARNRTGNVYTNIYIYSKKFVVDTLFSLDTEESEASITQLNVEHTHCKCGIRLRGLRAGAVSSIHAENLFMEDPEKPLLFIENSSLAIEALSVFYTGISHPHAKLIELGNAVYDIGHDWAVYRPENLGYLRIGTLHVKGLNDPWFRNYADWPNRGLHVKGIEDFRFFSRSEEAKGPYRVQIDQYVWYTFQGEAEIYEEFACEGPIDFLRKGTLTGYGTSKERPHYRLCPYQTTYFDTDLMQMLIWTGKEWMPTSIPV